MKVYRVSKESSAVYGRVELPASKSISNRILILKEHCDNSPTLHNLSQADDTLLLKDHLGTINRGQHIGGPTMLDCQNAGTVMRFLTAYLSTQPGEWILKGMPRMHQRPIGPLVESLKQLGAQIDYLETPGFPPLHIRGKALSGGSLEMDPSESSQFVSALLLIAPVLKGNLIIELKGTIHSGPYISMTLSMLKRCGVDCSMRGNRVQVAPSKMNFRMFSVEQDWSAASFFYEVLAISEEGSLKIPGLEKNSLQGDSILPGLYKPLGIQSTFTQDGLLIEKNRKHTDRIQQDFKDHPDLAQPFICSCAALGMTGEFSGLSTLRLKETDRLSALQSELAKMGVKCSTDGKGGFRILARKTGTGTIVEHHEINFLSHGDHRMAMALAPMALLFKRIRIEDPAVVSKSFPEFWIQLKKLGFYIEG